MVQNPRSVGDEPGQVSVAGHTDELASDVKELFQAAEQRHLELGLTWLRNLQDSVFANPGEAKIYALRRGGVAIAALPVVVTKAGAWHRCNSLSNYYSAIYAPVLAPGAGAADLAMILIAVRASYPSIASMRFSPMDPQSNEYRFLLEALKIAKFTPFEFFCFGNWYLPVRENWPAYLKGRNGALRSTIKRKGKKFEADGGRLELFQSGDDIGKALAAYQKVYAASWKVPEPFVDFIPGLVRACADKKWLRLGVAWLNDEPIAAQIWLVSCGTASIYKLAHHENFKTDAPGTLLTAMLMEHAIAVDKVREVDYLTGDDPYKDAWMSDRRERWGLIAYNARSMLGAFELMREIVGRSIKFLKEKLKLMTRTEETGG